MLESCKNCKHKTDIYNPYCDCCCFGSKFESKEVDKVYITTARGAGRSYMQEYIECLRNRDIPSYQHFFLKQDNEFEIKKVIFSYPCTVVLWADGTKTIVRCQDEDLFDPEKGLAMAFAKKALGNKGNYYDIFKKHVDWNTMQSLYPNTNFNFKLPDLDLSEACKAIEDWKNTINKRFCAGDKLDG